MGSYFLWIFFFLGVGKLELSDEQDNVVEPEDTDDVGDISEEDG